MKSFIAVCLLSALAGVVLSQQPPYNTQFFYLNPSSASRLPQQPPQMRFMQPPHAADSAEDDVEEAAQFHSQDGQGRFAFGYSMPDQVRIESRNIDGTVRGSYSYLDPTGLTVKVQYWDDGKGFHSAGNNHPVDIPQQVQDTPEVQAAREEHFRVYQATLERNAAVQDYIADRQNGEQYLYDENLDTSLSDDNDEGVIVESDSHTPVDEKGIELTRYPKVQIPQNLFDPSQVHDPKLEAVIVENPEILGPSLHGNSLRSAKSFESVVKPTGFSYSFTHPIEPKPYQMRDLRVGKNILPETRPNLSNRQGFSYSYTHPTEVKPVGMMGFNARVGKNVPPMFYSDRQGFSYSYTHPMEPKPFVGGVKTRLVRSLPPVEQRTGFSYSFSHPASTYIEVKPLLDQAPPHPAARTQLGPEADELRRAVDSAVKSSSQRVAAVHDAQVAPYQRSGVDMKAASDEDTAPLTVSQKAVYYGAIPVAAVHDQQVSPRQRDSVRNDQVLPLYIEHHGWKN